MNQTAKLSGGIIRHFHLELMFKIRVINTCTVGSNTSQMERVQELF